MPMVKLRDLKLAGQKTHTRWGTIEFDSEGLAEHEVPEDEIQMLRDVKPHSWLAEDQLSYQMSLKAKAEAAEEEAKPKVKGKAKAKDSPQDAPGGSESALDTKVMPAVQSEKLAQESAFDTTDSTDTPPQGVKKVPSLTDDEKSMVAAGKTVEAVRSVRDRTSCDMKIAKDLVETFAATLPVKAKGSQR